MTVILGFGALALIVLASAISGMIAGVVFSWKYRKKFFD